MQRAILTEYLTDIGNAIRERTGSTAKYKPSKMGKTVRNLPETSPHFKQHLEITGCSPVPSIHAGTLTHAYSIPSFVEVAQ